MRPFARQTARLLSNPWGFARQTLQAIRKNQGLLLAGALAYYALLSIVPLLILSVIALSRWVEQAQLHLTVSLLTKRGEFPETGRCGIIRAMDKKYLLALLAERKPEMAERFGVLRLALFGSTARGTAGVASDVDLLVAFDGPATSQRYFGLQFYLEDLLHCSVDLVTEKALRERLRPYVERDAIPV